jgi:hypothetical protein
METTALLAREIEKGETDQKNALLEKIKSAARCIRELAGIIPGEKQKFTH